MNWHLLVDQRIVFLGNALAIAFWAAQPPRVAPRAYSQRLQQLFDVLLLRGNRVS